MVYSCLINGATARFQRAMMRLSESHETCFNGQTDGAASAIKLAWMAES